jgi:hypothetical protein
VVSKTEPLLPAWAAPLVAAVMPQDGMSTPRIYMKHELIFALDAATENHSAAKATVKTAPAMAVDIPWMVNAGEISTTSHVRQSLAFVAEETDSELLHYVCPVPSLRD